MSEIQTVRELQDDGVFSGYFVNESMAVPLDPKNRDYKAVQQWIAEGNTVAPYQEPTPYVYDPDELFDKLIQQQSIIRALISALNDGTFVPGSNYTATQIKNGLKNRM